MTAASCTPAPSSVKRRTPEGGQLAHGGQPLTGPAHGDGAGHRHLAHGPVAQSQDLEGDGGIVDGRVGVGHRHHGREPAEGGGARPGLDRLGLLGPGLTEMGVEVDEARGHQAAAGVEHRGAPAARPEPGPRPSPCRP